MNATKNQKKKPLTLDNFAVLIQKDLARMATKDDIKVIHAELAATKGQIEYVQSEMRAGFQQINSDIKNITETMVSKADLTNAIADEFAKSNQ